MVVRYGLFIKLLNLGVSTQLVLIISLRKEEGYKWISVKPHNDRSVPDKVSINHL